MNGTGGIKSSQLIAGELSLAHEGILFADEFPEWHRDSRELLREPLERKKYTLTRLHERIEIPSHFILIANGNLCPCGGTLQAAQHSKDALCRCTHSERTQYQKRISGPILDRIDLRMAFSTSLPQSDSWISFGILKERILTAQASLLNRYSQLPGNMNLVELEAIIRSCPKLSKILQSHPFQSLRDRHQYARVLMTLSAWNNNAPFDSILFNEAQNYRMELSHEI
jgi:magnesium chelatase family protein